MLETLAERRRQDELMDQPEIESAVHLQALGGLSRINWWSRSGRLVWNAIESLAITDPQREWKVLDLASGAGDVTCALARHAGKRKLRMQFLGCDLSETAVALAQRRATAQGLKSSVRFESRDVLREPLPLDFDVVVCSLFLHHLNENDALLLLQKMASAARCLVLVNDLRRTRLGYAMAWLGCRLLSRSAIVHFDGPVSVEGAFTGEEIFDLAARAGLSNGKLTYHWPQRYLLHWNRGGAC